MANGGATAPPTGISFHTPTQQTVQINQQSFTGQKVTIPQTQVLFVYLAGKDSFVDPALPWDAVRMPTLIMHTE